MTGIPLSKGLLSNIKPKLNDSSRSWTPIIADLQQIATLAESFSKQRPKSDKNCLHLIDAVDREGVSGSFIGGLIRSLTLYIGVNLWNLSALLRESSDDDTRSVFATCEF